MENYYNLKYADPSGNNFLIISESQNHISYMANMIEYVESLKSNEVTQSYSLEKKEKFSKYIYSFLGDKDPLYALSALQLEHGALFVRESDTPAEFSIAAWDLLALISLSSDVSENMQAGNLDIDGLRSALYEVIQESNFNSFESIVKNNDPKNKISEILKSHEASVRGRQYQSISREINEVLINDPSVQECWKNIFGFTYGDILAVREAIHSVVNNKFNISFGYLDKIRQISNNFSKTSLGEEERSSARKILSSAFLDSPSEYYKFSTQEISIQSGINLDKVRRILSMFSLERLDLSSEDILRNYIKGSNPLRRKSLLRIDVDSWYSISEGILLDEIMKISEEGIKKGSPKGWAKYSRSRDKLFENLVYKIFKDILGDDAKIYSSFTYKNPGRNEEFDLSRESADYLKTDFTEADLLCIIDGIAICVEVKAGGIREAGREGHGNKLITDLEKTIAEASSQSHRLSNLLKVNGGVWDKDGNWCDFSEVKEIHQVVVCLEDLNSISPTLNSLIGSGVIRNNNLPWVVGVSDLLVFSKIIQSPIHFVRYIRTRTTVEAIKFIIAQDELDLLMWFIYGGLFFDPDPRRVYELDSSLRAPTKSDIKKYDSQGKVFVHTLTGKLDSFMYHSDDPDKYPVSKIEMHEHSLSSIVEQIESRKDEGWLRFSVTLCSLSSDAQTSLLNKIYVASEMSVQRRSEVNLSFASWGYDRNVIFCFMVGFPGEQALENFREYVKIKKHWMRVKSAFGIFLDPQLKIVRTLLMEYPYQENLDLDREARRRGYVPIEVIPRCSPPVSKRKNKKKKR